MELKLYICERCGNVIAMVKDKGVPVMCCGQKMKELIPSTTEASLEKHIPVWHKEGNAVQVTVGEVEHPMLPEHYIEFIFLETRSGTQFKHLSPGEKPTACFYVGENDEVIAAYAYCNLHSLWKG